MTYNGHSSRMGLFQAGKGIILFGIGLLGLSFACNRSDEISTEDLYGRWEIYQAQRNGKETPYLRRGYFEFQKDGVMKFNITGETEKGTFVMEGALIRFQGKKEFLVKSLQQDSMEMHYVSGPQSHFVFYMVKPREDVQ